VQKALVGAGRYLGCFAVKPV